MKFYAFILLFVYTLHKGVISWRSFEIRLLNVHCVKNSQLVIFINCTLSRVPKQQMGLCFSLQLSQKAKMPTLDFLIETKRRNRTNFVIANLTGLDACEFLENRGSIRIVKLVRQNFDKFANMPKKCPVEKDTFIYVKDLVLDPNDFPPYVPETEFTVTVKLWENMIPIFEVSVSGSVKSKRDWKNRPSVKKSN